MSHPPIIDAGPGLNFFSINKERLLIGVLGHLSAPETVQKEVFRKSRQEERFRAAAVVWRKLTPTWMQVLSDDQTPELAAVIHRITRQPMEQRLKRPKDLGEAMVIAHAVVAAEAGEAVTILIDDGLGARTATAEIRRLRRLHVSGRTVGSIRLVSTLTVLELAAGGQHIPDKSTMRTIYARLRSLDDGLPPIEETNLLGTAYWS
ncbi:hypothetical protein [Sciscionella marina]|uniref:hypothetical protein n=1 Tax=Sciscionella marina TaxID=508770 RepID=UPI00037CD283|nr:hypothetical protein [Sciscionella marina]